MSTRSSSPPSNSNSAHPVTYPSNRHQFADHIDQLRGSATATDNDNESDSEVTQEDELLLEGIIGGAAGVGDVQQHLCTDISMTGADAPAVG